MNGLLGRIGKTPRAGFRFDGGMPECLIQAREKASDSIFAVQPAKSDSADFCRFTKLFAVNSALKIICGLGLLLMLAVGVIFVLLGGPQSLQYRRHFDRLVRTNDHGTIARAAITVMRGTTNETLLKGDALTNLPPEISGMKPRYVSVTPEHMTIEFHGGFDHFGFKIEGRDDTWDMSWYTEKGRHPLLSLKGVADGSQPFRLETNRTSMAPGSDR